MKKSDFLALIRQIRYDQHGVNLQLSHQCRPDGVELIIHWQDERMRRKTTPVVTSSPSKYSDLKCKMRGWMAAR